MAKYGIQIKKGEIQYSITSDDRNFISGCIEDFFSRVKKQTKPFDKIAEPELIAEKLQPQSLLETTTSTTQKQYNQTFNETKKEEIERDDTINKMVKSLFEKSAEDTILDLKQTSNDNENNKNDLSELTDLLEPKLPQKEEILEPKDTNEDIIDFDDFNFNSILEDKIANPVYEEIQEQKKFNYDELLKIKQPESLTDYLIITAYYMLENENTDQFQLKQLNAKLFNSMNMVVDRKTIQKAIEDGLIYIVSDGIQNDGVVEYALTQAGQEFYKNGLA